MTIFKWCLKNQMSALNGIFSVMFILPSSSFTGWSFNLKSVNCFLFKNFPFVLLVLIMWTQQGWFFKLPSEQFVKWNASKKKLDMVWPMSGHLLAAELNAGLGSPWLVLLPYHCQDTDKCTSFEKWRLYQWINNCRATIDLTSHLTWDKRIQ